MLGFAAIGVAGVSLVLNIVGLALPYWLSVEEDILGFEISIHGGLWTFCSSFGVAGENCDSYESVSSELQATRAFVILGMLVLIGSLVCAILKLVVLKDMQMLPKAAGACAVAAGVMMIVGAVIFAAKVKSDLESLFVSSVPDLGLNLHAGFALTIVAAVGSFVAGALFIIDKGE